MDQGNQNSGNNEMTANTHGSSKELVGYLQALELLYRAELAEAEIEMWIHGLSCFPLAEIRGAVDALILNPPDGWTGMPKLPDVIRQIAENRESKAELAKYANHERGPDPACQNCRGYGYDIENNKANKCSCWAVRPKLPDLKQLAPAPEDRLNFAKVLERANQKAEDEKAVRKLAEKLPNLELAAKKMPEYSTYMPSEAELERKKQEALELAKKFS